MQFWSRSYYNEFKFNMSDQVKALNMGNTYDISLERSCLTIDVCCLLPRDDSEGRTSRLWRSVDDVGHHSTCSNRTIEARGPRTTSLIWVTNRKWFFPFNWSADYRWKKFKMYRINVQTDGRTKGDQKSLLKPRLAEQE